MRKLILLVSLILPIISGCGVTNESDNTSDTSNVKKTNTENSAIFEPATVDIEYDKSKWELKIGDNVLITAWRADDFPKDFPVVKWWKIYKNSNMKQYMFYMIEGVTVTQVSNYYKKVAKKLWWEEVKEKKVKTPKRPTNEKEEKKEITDVSLRYMIKHNDKKQNLSIRIKTTIPMNLQKMGMKGIFVEVQIGR